MCKSQKYENRKIAQKYHNDPKNHFETFDQIYDF